MKSLILIFLIFSQSFFCFANSKIDSLKNELQLEHPDTTKSIILSKLSFHYHREDIDSGIHYSQKAYELAAKNEYVKGLQSALNSLGINYLNGGKLDSALITFRKLKDITDTTNAALVATIYTNMALVYQSFSDYPKAIDYYYKAIDYYYKAILLYKEAKLIDRIYGISHNMGMIYIKQKDLEKAKTHYRQLLRSAIRENDTIQYSKFYKSLGNVFYSLKEFDSTEYYFKKSLELDEKLGTKSSYAISLGNMANLFFAKKDFENALTYYSRALKLEKEIGNKEGLARNYANLGELYYNIAKDNNSSESISLAEDYLKKSINLYNEMGEKQNKSETIRLLSLVFEYSKKYDKAFENMRIYSDLSDSLKIVQTKNSLRKLEFERDEKFRLRDIEYLEKENQFKTNQLIFLIILSVFTVIIVIITLVLYNTKKKQNKILEEGIKRRTAELEQAKSELFNSLESEKELSDMKSNFILTVSHEFRTPLTAISSTSMILEVIGKDVPEMQKHIKVINDSVRGLNELIENIITYSSATEEKIDTNYSLFDAQELINELIDWAKKTETIRHIYHHEILIKNQNIISNKDLIKKALKQILKNSISFSDFNDKIKISINETSSDWSFKVSDEGSGIEEKNIRNVFEPFFKSKKNIGVISGTGLGLTLAKKYIEMINGKIEIESTVNKGTTVIISIPKSN